MSVIHVAWGATEGGRDTLEWVRQLVRATEARPFSSAMPVVRQTESDHITAHRGLVPLMKQAWQSSERAQVQKLASWLSDALLHLKEHLPVVRTCCVTIGAT
jgi:hypothetical protein